MSIESDAGGDGCGKGWSRTKADLSNPVVQEKRNKVISFLKEEVPDFYDVGLGYKFPLFIKKWRPYITFDDMPMFSEVVMMQLEVRIRINGRHELVWEYQEMRHHKITKKVFYPLVGDYMMNNKDMEDNYWRNLAKT